MKLFAILWFIVLGFAIGAMSFGGARGAPSIYPVEVPATYPNPTPYDPSPSIGRYRPQTVYYQSHSMYSSPPVGRAMKENPIKPLRIAAAIFSTEVHKMVPDKEAVQKALDDMNAEAHKAGLKVQIVVSDP